MRTNSKSMIFNNANSGKSIAWTIVLIIFGIAALYGGVKWLSLLVPAAILVWYGARPIMQAGRN
jgi:hypothetical protein